MCWSRINFAPGLAHVQLIVVPLIPPQPLPQYTKWCPVWQWWSLCCEIHPSTSPLEVCHSSLRGQLNKSEDGQFFVLVHLLILVNSPCHLVVRRALITDCRHLTTAGYLITATPLCCPCCFPVSVPPVDTPLPLTSPLLAPEVRPICFTLAYYSPSI